MLLVERRYTAGLGVGERRACGIALEAHDGASATRIDERRRRVLRWQVVAQARVGLFGCVL